MILNLSDHEAGALITAASAEVMRHAMHGEAPPSLVSALRKLMSLVPCDRCGQGVRISGPFAVETIDGYRHAVCPDPLPAEQAVRP